VSSAPRRERPSALLVDLDGVLRRWDPAFTAAVEERYGLAPGALLTAALEPDRLRPVVTGRVSRAEWLAGIGEAVGSAEAVAEWMTFRGTVDPEVLGFIRQVRTAGLPVALATNATDAERDDLAALGLTDELDAVVNSAELGVAKPAPEFYAAACAAVRVPPRGCLLVDDTDRNVRGARAAGLAAHRWTGPADLPYLRAALGLPAIV
jgi:putative hydrolase of the HAD superfamily